MCLKPLSTRVSALFANTHGDANSDSYRIGNPHWHTNSDPFSICFAQWNAGREYSFLR